MSLQYLLDGYNIIHQMAFKPSTEIDAQRQQLIHFIETERPHGSSANNVTVVFDGRTGRSGPPRTLGTKVIFTQEISADEEIRDIVHKAGNKKNIIVVTDDRDIRYAVRSDGAQVLSVKDFLSRPAPGQRTSGSGKSSSKAAEVKNISKSLEFKINAELEEIWLKKKKA